MFARVITFEGKAAKVDEGIRNYREKVVPTIKNWHGFTHAYLLVDRKTGVEVSVVLWETEKNLPATTAALQLRSQFAQVVGADKPPTVGDFEVAEQA